MSPILGYARCSSDEQANSGAGLAAQEAKILERYPEAVIYRDEGISGKTLDRPALNEALEAIAVSKGSGLIVAKLDRLTRSVIDFAMLLEWFEHADARLVALDFDLDTSTPGGRLVATIFAAVAEWERGIISQRTSDALQAMKGQGRRIGPPAVSDSTRALIATMRQDGLTIRQIAEELNRQSVPTARGGRWSPSVVHHALGNRRRPPRRRVASLPAIRRNGR